MRAEFAAILAVLCLQAWRCQAHPLCLDFSAPYPQGSTWLNFCAHINTNKDGSCCNQQQDGDMSWAFWDSVGKAAVQPVSQECQDLHKLVTCSQVTFQACFAMLLSLVRQCIYSPQCLFLCSKLTYNLSLRAVQQCDPWAAHLHQDLEVSHRRSNL